MAPGDVVIADFPGVMGVKRRPAVVLSSDQYHRSRPDVILGLLTSNTSRATEVSDYLLQDWQAAGLHRPTAFRAFLFTMPAQVIVQVGRLSDRDWIAVQDRLRISLQLS